MCMKIACPKKIVSNIPVLASLCFMRSVYLTPYSALQELLIKFIAMWCRKCYNTGSFPKILRHLNVNQGAFILTWNSGMIKLVDWHWLLDFVVCRENNFNRFSLPINPYFKNVMWLEK